MAGQVELRTGGAGIHGLSLRAGFIAVSQNHLLHIQEKFSLQFASRAAGGESCPGSWARAAQLPQGCALKSQTPQSPALQGTLSHRQQ